MNKTKKSLLYLSITVGILLLLGVEFVCHRCVPFMMDDEWYSTNLATGAPLVNWSDILEGQLWHYFNWGGRVITHGILQLTLMTGELAADIFNLIMTGILAWMICVLARQKHPFWFLTASTMLIGLNANIKMSMFWQAGTANYVYATAWILLFLWVYLRQLEQPDNKALPLVSLWIVPLGLITGWSNENMGPASFLLTVAVILLFKRKLKRAVPLWMYLGSLFCLLGSLLVILAPGNFVRTAALPETGFVTALYQRLLSMLGAGTDFLFPTAVLLTAVLLIYLVCFQGRLSTSQWLLLAHAVLSYGAMVLSPHYPDRATFGTMAVGIALIISILAQILRTHKAWIPYVGILTGSIWLYSLYALFKEIAISITLLS